VGRNYALAAELGLPPGALEQDDWLQALSGNALLERYMFELVSRCSLILALYSRPHSSECHFASSRARSG
jgi:hypothetical protein